MPENQNIEYKQTWRDEYLKWICGFANAQGGKIYIGIDDEGNVTGVEDYKKLLEDIPNKAVSLMGIVVDVNLLQKNKKHYIEIVVQPSSAPISYHGIHHYRSGSTKQELKGTALQEFLLKKIGISWEQKPIPEASMKDIDEKAIKFFVKRAIAHNRISESAVNSDTKTLLKNLELINDKGEFLLAALLLFGNKPKKYAPAAYFKIGRFGNSHSDLKFQDIIEGNILEMADKVMETLDKKYLIRPISYKGLQRMEPLEYPEKALREAILNSIIHKDYSRTTIFLSIYDDKLMIWNPGELPENLTIERLKGKHGSEPRNRLIADIFFMAGYIEAWGRGIGIIMDGCKEYKMPEPLIVEEQGGLSVTFLKDILTKEYIHQLDISERQRKAVFYIKEHGKITNAIYQEINAISKPTATRDLKELIEKGLIKNIGTKGKSSDYKLIGS